MTKTKTSSDIRIEMTQLQEKIGEMESYLDVLHFQLLQVEKVEAAAIKAPAEKVRRNVTKLRKCDLVFAGAHGRQGEVWRRIRTVRWTETGAISIQFTDGSMCLRGPGESLWTAA